jgi:hypothetical protein
MMKNPPYPGILRTALTNIFSEYQRAIGPKSIAKKYRNRILTSHLTLVECSLAVLWSNADLTCVMQDVQPKGTRLRRGADSSGDGCCGDGELFFFFANKSKSVDEETSAGSPKESF